MLVALDTMTMIWGLRIAGCKPGNPKQANLAQMHFRAEVLLETLEAQKSTRIVVPTVVVEELLLGVEKDNHGSFLATIQSRFFCPPYDIHATAIAAKLHIAHNSYPTEEQYLSRKKLLNSDVRIIATSFAAGARVVYSDDRKFRKLADSLGMVARELPVAHEDMFRNSELRKKHGLPLD